jgi:hypothetical protein
VIPKSFSYGWVTLTGDVELLPAYTLIQPRIRLHAIHATKNAFFPRPRLFGIVELPAHLNDIGFTVFLAHRLYDLG